MKIIEAEKFEAHSIETDEPFNCSYTRYSPDNWMRRIGESEEPLYDCEEIERLYQEFMRNRESEVPDYDVLVEQVKKLLEVVEAPRCEAGCKEVVQQERKQYFEAKKVIMKSISEVKK